MTQTNPFIPEPDQSTTRRQALAKVYSILIRLAEEAESESEIPEAVYVQEKTEDISQNIESLASREV